jgi:hypothetical protein
MRGVFPGTIDGKRCAVEYEPNGERRDTARVPVHEPGGIEALIRRAVVPHAPDARIDEARITICADPEMNVDPEMNKARDQVTPCISRGLSNWTNAAFVPITRRSFTQRR